MKKKKSLKLTLNKESISQLTNTQMGQVQGGATDYSCPNGGMCSPSDNYQSCAVGCDGTAFYPKCTVAPCGLSDQCTID